eukprot:5313076-Prymnesium_polylepis.2
MSFIRTEDWSTICAREIEEDTVAFGPGDTTYAERGIIDDLTAMWNKDTVMLRDALTDGLRQIQVSYVFSKSHKHGKTLVEIGYLNAEVIAKDVDADAITVGVCDMHDLRDLRIQLTAVHKTTDRY